MSILTWILVGLIAGWLAGTIMRGGGFGIIGDVVVGIVGALIGGFLGTFLFGGDYITGLNLTTILVSMAGFIILIWALRLASGRRVV